MEGVKREIALLGVQKLRKLLLGESVGKGGVINNLAVCHGVVSFPACGLSCCGWCGELVSRDAPGLERFGP